MIAILKVLCDREKNILIWPGNCRTQKGCVWKEKRTFSPGFFRTFVFSG